MRFLNLPFAALLALSAMKAEAQERPGPWRFSVEGAYFGQSDADLSGGGAFSVNRGYGRFGAFYRTPSGFGLGVSVSGGQSDYDFVGAAPWGRVNEQSVSLTFAGQTAGGARYFIAPTFRSRYEQGTSMSNGSTGGVFAGISWRVSDTLTIGPAFGAFSGLGADDYDIFPALLLDWQVTDRLSLTTGPTIGASQGPGLTARYALNDGWALSLSARSEKNRFALSDTGPTPGGTGEDRSIPVVLSLTYDPSPAMTLALFAGAEFDGQLRVENAAGTVISRRSYDVAPLMGVAFSLSF